MTTPHLTTSRLVLDAAGVDDARSWSAAQDDECAHWFDWPARPGLERCRDYLSGLGTTENDYVWAIRLNGTFVGGIDLKLTEENSWNVSYFIDPHFRGRRIAREALRAVVTWGFESLGLDVITTEVHADNTASRKVLESAGFRVTQHVDDDTGHHIVDYQLTRRSLPHAT